MVRSLTFLMKNLNSYDNFMQIKKYAKKKCICSEQFKHSTRERQVFIKI